MDYLTLAKNGTGEYSEKRSRFIGYAAPVTDEQQAIDFVAAIRKKHPDARHNIYAYTLRERNLTRYSDDGEPQGTAGLPVLELLQKKGLCDAAIVVTRYFGGVLLGTGGLLRAYTAASKAAIEAAGIVRMSLCTDCTLECEYGRYGDLSALLTAHGAVVTDSDFSDIVRIGFYIESERLEELSAAVTDKSCGSVVINKEGNQYRGLDL